MKSLVYLSLGQFTSSIPVLTGVSRARKLLAALISWSADASPKGTLILDFKDLPDASASFLRESILAFRDYVRAYQPDVFPVVANVSAAVREELDTLLKARREAMLVCLFEAPDRASEPVVLGLLEPGLSQTLEAIRARGQLTLGELPSGTKPTTWSNRVASLIRQGFVVPSPEPNKRLYRFVLADAGGESGS